MKGNQICDILERELRCLYQIVYSSLKDKEDEASDQEWIQCEYCAKKFKSFYYFYAHSELHPEFKDYKCEVCQLEFDSLTNLREHQNTHQQHACIKCDERFISKSDLAQHKRNAHRHLSLFRRKLVKCGYCPKVCKSTYGFYIHSVVHPEFKNYKCEICEVVFDKMRKLKAHQAEHKTFQCPKCDKMFVSQLALAGHKYTHTHSTRCNICDIKISGGRQSLADHMNIHTGRRPHMCEICGKGFKQLAHLNTHMFQHGAQKPWKCKLCEKAFHYESMLKQHVRSHTGEKPFPCLYCKKVFRDTTIRHKHIKKFHPEKRIEFEVYRRNHLRDEIRKVEENGRDFDSLSDSSENEPLGEDVEDGK